MNRHTTGWNVAAGGDPTGKVMTGRPHGNGNSFGFTVQHGGNRTWPALTCRTA